MFEVIIGRAVRNLILEVSTPTDNHRTYCIDGVFFTGTDSYDALPACSAECVAALVADYPLHGEVSDRTHTTVAVHVSSDATGDEHTDATVYPWSAEGVDPDQLPIICAHCGTAMAETSPVVAKYENAHAAHAPSTPPKGGSWTHPLYPLCGRSNASPNADDPHPICETEADFLALPDDMTCWECRSILS